jgi:hypothetical protein
MRKTPRPILTHFSTVKNKMRHTVAVYFLSLVKFLELFTWTKETVAGYKVSQTIWVTMKIAKLISAFRWWFLLQAQPPQRYNQLSKICLKKLSKFVMKTCKHFIYKNCKNWAKDQVSSHLETWHEIRLRCSEDLSTLTSMTQNLENERQFGCWESFATLCLNLDGFSKISFLNRKQKTIKSHLSARTQWQSQLLWEFKSRKKWLLGRGCRVFSDLF